MSILTKSMNVMMKVRMLVTRKTIQVSMTPNVRVSSPTQRPMDQIDLYFIGTIDMRRMGMSGLRKLSPGNFIRAPYIPIVR